MLFLTTLQQNCVTYADKTALTFIYSDAEETVSYGQLEETIQRTMALLLSMGVCPGDRVAVQLPKCLPFIYLHLAIMRSGAIMLPLNPGYPEQELTYFLQDSGARLLFADVAKQAALTPIVDAIPTLLETVYLDVANSADFHTRLPAPRADRPPPPSDPDATALMVYTSGTTGRPKGALSSHGNLTANLTGLHSAWGWQADDILLHVLPIFHVHGLMVALHGALNAGATSILLPKFEPIQAIQLLQNRRCTVFMAVPTIHKRLVECPDATQADLSHMRLLTSGSDRLPNNIFEKFQTLFGHTLLERYGMTETGMNLSNPLHGERRVGSVGMPLPLVEARIVDPETDAPLPDGNVGEVQIRGPHVFKGYWQMAQKTADSFTADGWLRTGDLGERSDDGYYTLKGRSKDLIITGGLNVYPPEVERIIAELPEVFASAVIGCPDDEWGERITAVVVLREAMTLSAENITAHCRAALAAYKVPREIRFADALPRNALGKVQKAKLRATCGEL